MRKLFLILLTSCLALAGNSQELLPQGYDTLIHQHQLSVSGIGFYQTSHLRNDFSNNFLTGGFISDDIKDNSRLSEDENGRLGGELVAEIVYKSGTPLFKKKENLGWLVKAGTSINFGAQYAPDAYDLFLYGNENMLGQEITISNTAAFVLSYHKLGFGVYNRTNKNSLTLNLLLGNSYSNIDVNRGNLVFSEDGGEVQAVTDIRVQQSNSPAYFDGIGASLDFELHAQIKDVPGISGVFQISGRNLGVMYVNRIEQFTLNTNTTYDGFSFNQLTDLVDNTDEEMTTFFDSLGFARSTASGVMLLPGGFLQAGKIVEENSDNKFQSFFGFRVLTNIVHKPMIYGGGHYSFNDWASIGGQLTFGGYGVFRAGIYAQGDFEKWSIGIGTEDAPGFIAKSTFGKSVLMRVKWRI